MHCGMNIFSFFNSNLEGGVKSKALNMKKSFKEEAREYSALLRLFV